MKPPANTLATEAGALPPRLTTPRPAAGPGPALAVAAFLVVAVALFLFNPAEHAFYPRCLFHQWTGLHCPGCGGLRALHQLAHGHLLEALRHNALAVLALPLAAALAGREWLRHRRGLGGRRFVSAWFLWAGLAALLVFAVLRNLPALAFLAP